MAWRWGVHKGLDPVIAPLPPRTLPAHLPDTTVALLEGLASGWVVLDAAFQSVRASRDIHDFAILRNGRLYEAALRGLVDAAVRNRTLRSLDLDLGVAQGAPPRNVRARAVRLDENFVVLLLEDVSQAARVDAMRRDFIVNVSHELKTPVGALILLADAVQSAMDDPEALQRFTERIQLEAQRLNALVSDLTDLSRLQAEDLVVDARDVAVERLVAEALDTTRMLAQAKRIDLVSDVDPALVVHGDEEHLVTALRNLLVNAVAYSPAFTKVSVSAGRRDGYVEMSVSDEGIGIAHDEQERIFERFYRVDRARSRETGGTGLGLAIVKHICIAHGGDCRVDSMPGAGSTFTMRVPQTRTMTRSEAGAR